MPGQDDVRNGDAGHAVVLKPAHPALYVQDTERAVHYMPFDHPFVPNEADLRRPPPRLSTQSCECCVCIVHADLAC